ncbi:hypothetical protein EQV93_21500 [Pseudomonas sp. TMW22091]|nr:hypothetical protein [Pseudomonas sp. TMW22091]
MYELSLVRTLKTSPCGHNLARTHYWKYAAQTRCALHIWAQTGLAIARRPKPTREERSSCSRVARMLRNVSMASIS